MRYTLLFISLLLTGCSTLGSLATSTVAGALVDDKPLVGVDTEIVAGDKEQAVKLGSESSVKMEDVEVKDNAQVHNTTAGKKTDVNATADTINMSGGVEFWDAIIAAVGGIFLGLFLPQLKVIRKRV